MHSSPPQNRTKCTECGARDETWEKHRKLPQVGQTYVCDECGHEVYVYYNRDGNDVVKQFRPVTDSMAMNLLFFAEVGDWPDSALEDLFKQGLERAEAIDYHITENEGLSQNEWAKRTDRAQPSVSENVAKAREKLTD